MPYVEFKTRSRSLPGPSNHSLLSLPLCYFLEISYYDKMHIKFTTLPCGGVILFSFVLAFSLWNVTVPLALPLRGSRTGGGCFSVAYLGFFILVGGLRPKHLTWDLGSLSQETCQQMPCGSLLSELLSGGPDWEERQAGARGQRRPQKVTQHTQEVTEAGVLCGSQRGVGAQEGWRKSRTSGCSASRREHELETGPVDRASEAPGAAPVPSSRVALLVTHTEGELNS